MHKFSLRSFFVSIAFVAISLAALASANRIWATVFTTFLMLILLAALIAPIYESNRERKAFWIGFAVFGWGALLLMNSWLTNNVNLTAATHLDSDIAQLFTGSMECGQVAHSIIVLLYAIAGGVTARIFYRLGSCKGDN